jgi:hypothetical protein
MSSKNFESVLRKSESSQNSKTTKKKVFGVYGEVKRTKPTPKINVTKEKITEIFDARIDILTIDSVIKNNFEKELGSLEQMKEDLAALILIKSRSPYETDRRNAQREEEIIRRRVRGIEFGARLSMYLWRTNDIIEKYKTLLPKSRIGFSTEVPNSEELQKLSLDFLRIAKDYIKLENFKGLKVTADTCPVCLIPVFQRSDESGFAVCKCGVILDILNPAPSYNDSKRVNCSTRFKHNAKIYLDDAMDRFECKQGEIGDHIMKAIFKQMDLHGLTRDTVKKDDIYRFLTIEKLSDGYADINAIYCSITGASPPDISKYRLELLEMSAQFEPVCKRVVENRTNALTVLWKLYMFLKLLDYPCGREEFYCLKTTTKQEEHQHYWDLIIKELIELYPNEKTSNGKARWRHLTKDKKTTFKKTSK